MSIIVSIEREGRARERVESTRNAIISFLRDLNPALSYALLEYLETMDDERWLGKLLKMAGRAKSVSEFEKKISGLRKKRFQSVIERLARDDERVIWARNSIIDFLKDLNPLLPETLLLRIESIMDEAKLNTVLKLAAKANTLAEFEAKLGNLN